MPMKHQIMEFKDGYHVIYKKPQSSIDAALRLALKAINGNYGFAYLTVHEHAWRNHTDKVALRAKMYIQYKKLKAAFKLLFTEGIITSYTILANGRLIVNWFNGHIKMDLVILDETFVKMLQVFYDCTNMKHYKLTRWWEYLNVPSTYDMQKIGGVGRYIYKHRDEVMYTKQRVYERRLKKQTKLWREDHQTWLDQQHKVACTKRVNKVKHTLKGVF